MSRKNALNTIAAVNKFLENTSKLWNQYEHQPLPNSRAAKELAEFPRPESIGTVYSQGTILIEVAADYAFATAKTLTEPAETIAPWACARGVLETSALSMWLLDTGVDASERVKRSLAFRYDGLDQQKKFMKSAGGRINPQTIVPRIVEIEQIVLSLGFDKVTDINGKRIGVGQKMPSVTEIVIRMLNKEQDYRLLSAMVHAHPWALQLYGFIKTDQDQMIFGNVKGAYFEKHISADSIFFMYKLCDKSLSGAFNELQPFWLGCKTIGNRDSQRN